MSEDSKRQEPRKWGEEVELTPEQEEEALRIARAGEEERVLRLRKGHAEKGYWTMAEEKRPWQQKEFRGCTLDELGLVYLLAHGRSNGRSEANLTVGINRSHLSELAGQIDRSTEEVQMAMDSLVQRGVALHDPEVGLTVLPQLVAPCSNASHFQGVVRQAMNKLPSCELRDEYLRILVRETRGAARDWEADRHAFEAIVRDLARAFPDAMIEEVGDVY